MSARRLATPRAGLGMALGAMALAACSTTAVTGAPDEVPAAEAPAETAADGTSVATVDDPATTSTPAPTTAEPAATVPAATAPPTTEPPVTEPPVTEPPVTEPPVTEPPATTLPPEVVLVPAMTEPIQAVGSSDGAETSRAQWRLLELGFWLQEPNGDYGLTTRQAVMAFQKYYGLEADGVLGPETAQVMSTVTEKPSGRSDAGTLVEVDKGKQLLFFIRDGRTEWILNTSTGTEIPYEEPNKNDPTKIERGSSITPNGLHNVNRERPEGWWEGDLGEIYRPKYFVGGVAVHGSNSIPAYPASHGCVRVSVPAMDWIWDSNLMPMDIPVWVHGAIPTA